MWCELGLPGPCETFCQIFPSLKSIISMCLSTKPYVLAPHLHLFTQNSPLSWSHKAGIMHNMSIVHKGHSQFTDLTMHVWYKIQIPTPFSETCYKSCLGNLIRARSFHLAHWGHSAWRGMLRYFSLWQLGVLRGILMTVCRISGIWTRCDYSRYWRVLQFCWTGHSCPAGTPQTSLIWARVDLSHDQHRCILWDKEGHSFMESLCLLIKRNIVKFL